MSSTDDQSRELLAHLAAQQAADHQAELAAGHTALFLHAFPQTRPDVAHHMYRLDPPYGDQGWEYVVVSAANVWMSGPEVMVFTAFKDVDEIGDSLMEMRGPHDAAEVLAELGYTAVGAEPFPDLPPQSYQEVGMPPELWEQMDRTTTNMLRMYGWPPEAIAAHLAALHRTEEDQ